MSKEERPYVRHCGFCEEGMLRFMRCRECDSVSVICDECELAWSDIAEVSEKANAKSSGSFPACPNCGELKAGWDKLDIRGVRRAKLDAYVAGESE
jgi:hypothetical protein